MRLKIILVPKIIGLATQILDLNFCNQCETVGLDFLSKNCKYKNVGPTNLWVQKKSGETMSLD